MAVTLSVVPSIPVAGMALIFGVDKFMSECRALTNIIGNGVATVVISAWERELDRTKLASALHGRAAVSTTWQYCNTGPVLGQSRGVVRNHGAVRFDHVNHGTAGAQGIWNEIARDGGTRQQNPLARERLPSQRGQQTLSDVFGGYDIHMEMQRRERIG